MQHIISGYQWAGYCGETTLRKKADGSKKETHHHKIWAICATTDAHVIVRYGSAEQPLHLKEEVARKETMDAAIADYQRRVSEKSTRKKERYTHFAFDASPHFLEDFDHYFREKRLKEEGGAPLPSGPSRPDEDLFTVQACLEALAKHWLSVSCPRCGTPHPSYLIDLGGGQMMAANTLLEELSSTADGRHWLSTPCTRRGELLLHPTSATFLGRIVDVQHAMATGNADTVLALIPCPAILRMQRTEREAEPALLSSARLTISGTEP